MKSIASSASNQYRGERWRALIKKSWERTWNSIYLLTRKMFIATLVMLVLTGILTWYGIEFLGLQERNMLIAPLLKFGTSWIFVWDIIAITLTSIIYGTTRKSRNIHCIMILFLFIGASFDVINNIGQVFNIPLFKALENSPNPILLIKKSEAFLDIKNQIVFSIKNSWR